MNTREIREQRGKYLKRARDIIEKAEAEKREMSAEETANFEAAHKECDRLLQQAVAVESQEEREKDQAEAEERARIEAAKKVKLDVHNRDDRKAIHKRAYRKWMVGGMNALDHEERAVMAETRAQTTTAAEGGYTIPEDFQAELEKALLAYGGMRQVARVLPTASGADLPWPTVNDTGTSGAILAEADADAEAAVTFASVTLGAYMYTSGIVLVSYELMQDTGINLEAELAQMLGTRLGRITNAHFTTGTGTGQPKGVVIAAVDSSVDLDISAGTTWDNLVDLYHSVDPDYRTNGSWMMSDDQLSRIRKIQSFDGTTALPQLAWQAGLAAGEPNTILGKPYTINQAVPAGDTDTYKCLLFGDFSKYIIRDVVGVTLLRLTERYSEYLQVGFNAFSRHDGDLIDAGTNPIKYANAVP